MTALSVKGSEAFQIYPLSFWLVLRLLPTILFSSFSSLFRSLKSKRIEVPSHSFSRNVQHFLSWETEISTVQAAGFVFGCYATRLGWLQVVKRKKQHLPNNVFEAPYFEDSPSYLRLNILNATRTLRLFSQVMLQVPSDVRHLPSQRYSSFQCATTLHQELLRF